MGASQSEEVSESETPSGPKGSSTIESALCPTTCAEPSLPCKSPWGDSQAARLQESVDLIFGEDTESSLQGLTFSFSIADPSLDDCPLIGCSAGFSELTGFEVDDIVGHNCRFLVEGVPSQMQDRRMRQWTKDFCKAVMEHEDWIPPRDYPYGAPDRACDELICLQANAKKDGTLFHNLFFLKVFQLSVELGDEQPFIVGLQSELPSKDSLSAIAANSVYLSQKMEKVKEQLSSLFYMQCSMSRQISHSQRGMSTGLVPAGFGRQ